jgi:hypothetical protein
MDQTFQLLGIKMLFQPALLRAYLNNPLKSWRRRNAVLVRFKTLANPLKRRKRRRVIISAPPGESCLPWELSYFELLSAAHRLHVLLILL